MASKNQPDAQTDFSGLFFGALNTYQCYFGDSLFEFYSLVCPQPLFYLSRLLFYVRNSSVVEAARNFRSSLSGDTGLVGLWISALSRFGGLRIFRSASVLLGLGRFSEQGVGSSQAERYSTLASNSNLTQAPSKP